MSAMLPSTRALSGPSLITVWRHFQMSRLSSTPRLRLMFDHLVAPGTLRMRGRPLSSTECCSITEVSESSPLHSRNMPTPSWPPRSSRK